MLTPGKRSISADRIVLNQRLKSQKTVKQFRTFLGVNWILLGWIPGYGLDAKPLYELLKQNAETGPLNWGDTKEQVFQILRLPNLEKTFFLFWY